MNPGYKSRQILRYYEVQLRMNKYIKYRIDYHVPSSACSDLITYNSCKKEQEQLIAANCLLVMQMIPSL